MGSEDQSQNWAWSPIFGLAVFTTAVSNLSYLGIPVKASAPLVVLACAVLSYLTLRRAGEAARTAYLPRPFFIALAGTLLFLAPYILTGAFPFFGDEFTYVSIADFIRDFGYFANSEPAHETPWKSQMLLYQTGGFRMGMQYFLAGVASLTGGPSVAAYVPVTAICLYCCYCAMWLLLRATLPQHSAVWLGFLVYVTNLMMVQWPAAINLLPQTGGMALIIAFFASLFFLPTAGFRQAATTGLLLSAACLAYSEMLPMVVACSGLFTVGLLLKREATLPNAVAYWLKCGGVALVINPYMLFYSIKGIVTQSASRPGWPVELGLIGYLRMSFGLIGPVELHPLPAYAASGLAVLLGIFTLAGFWFLQGRARILMITSTIVFAGLELYFSFVDVYSYGAYKILLFSFYLLPVLFGAGIFGCLGLLPPKIRRGGGYSLALGWLLLAGLVQFHYLRSAYDTSRHAFYAHPEGSGGAMKHFSDLAKISGLVKPGERTLQFIPEDHLNKWVSYYFRGLVGLYFKGPFFNVINGRELPKNEAYQYLLLNRRSSTVKDAEQVLFENDLFTFSRMQSFVSFAEKGWYDWEDVGGKTMRWMANKAELIAYSPSRGNITLGMRVYLGPDGKKKTVLVSRDGKELARSMLSAAANDIVFRDIALDPGFQTLTIETDIPTVQAGSDPRILNVMVEPLMTVSNQSKLSTTVNAQTALITGLGTDGWVFKSGIEFTLGVERAGPHQLVISGDIPGIPAILPQQFVIEAAGRRQTLTVSGGGSFTLKAPLGQLEGSTVRVRITPGKSFIPKSMGINQDPRSLAFHLVSAELQRD